MKLNLEPELKFHRFTIYLLLLNRDLNLYHEHDSNSNLQFAIVCLFYVTFWLARYWKREPKIPKVREDKRDVVNQK